MTDTETPSTRTAVRDSTIHGWGLFAAEDIPAGAHVIDYGGELVLWDVAVERQSERNTPAGLTFLFDVGNDWVIDGGSRGNDARWINHSCDPNAQALIEGERIEIRATRDIRAGDEVLLDYQLAIDEDVDDCERAAYACGCGAASCRETMLA